MENKSTAELIKQKEKLLAKVAQIDAELRRRAYKKK